MQIIYRKTRFYGRKPSLLCGKPSLLCGKSLFHHKTFVVACVDLRIMLVMEIRHETFAEDENLCKFPATRAEMKVEI